MLWCTQLEEQTTNNKQLNKSTLNRNLKGQLQMFKKISVFLLATAMLLSVPACSMPDNIFADGTQTVDEQNDSNSMSDIYDFEFTLGEQKFQLPVNYGAFSSRGWKISEAAESVTEEQDAKTKTETKVYSADSELEPDEYSDYLPLVQKEAVINARFYNDSKQTKSISDCKVIGIRLDADNDNVPSFTLQANDLSVGSKYDSVLNACGKPSYVECSLKSTGDIVSINDVEFIKTDEETVSTLYYKLNDHSFLSFELGELKGVSNSVVTITVENDYPYEKPYDYSKELKYKTESIDLYKGPNLLGKQFSDFAFKYEGNLYTLPIPVRKMIDNGWEFVRGYGERVPMGTTVDGLIMRKGNLAVSMMIHNYDTKYAHTAINCYAVSLEACLTGPNASVLLSKGITLGSTEKQLIDALGKDYAKTHTVADDAEEVIDDTAAKGAKAAATDNQEPDKYEIPNMPDYYIEKTVGEEYTVYSYVMPDDVPTITLPVSITDIGDTGADLLGGIRKHIDVYVSNETHLIHKFYLQNCPEYIVDENKIIEEQLEAQRKKEKEEWEKQQKEQAENNNG